MQTIDEIESELRADCPTIDGSVPGEAHYEAKIKKFVAARVEHLSRLAEMQSRKVWPTVSEFWAEFEGAEKYAIEVSSDPEIIVLRADLKLWLKDVWSDDPRIVYALGKLVTVGILTEERRASILQKA
jgi:hypothetical protein